MVDKYTMRTGPPTRSGGGAAGATIYIVARLWNFWPILGLGMTRPTGCT